MWWINVSQGISGIYTRMSSKNTVLCKACHCHVFLSLSLWSSFNMCQLCVITQVLHSCCRCRCFDGAPTCPLALCWLSSKDSGSTPAACFLVFLCNVAADCGTIQLIVVPIRTGCSWKLLQAFSKKFKKKPKQNRTTTKKTSKVPIWAETSAAQLKLGRALIFTCLVHRN